MTVRPPLVKTSRSLLTLFWTVYYRDYRPALLRLESACPYEEQNCRRRYRRRFHHFLP